MSAAGGGSPAVSEPASGEHAGTAGSSSSAAMPLDPVAPLVFALLVLACFAAFILAQRLKHTPTVLQNFRLTPIFSPAPAGHIKEERISFKLAQADEVTVSILNSSNDEIATLVSDRPVRRYKQFSLRWNGRRGVAPSYTTRTRPDGATIVVPVNTGSPAPTGEYRVKVSLRAQRRSVLSPNNFKLVRK